MKTTREAIVDLLDVSPRLETEIIWEIERRKGIDIEDDESWVHDTLFHMVREGTLTWHLPDGVDEEDPRALEVPLLYRNSNTAGKIVVD